MRQDQKICPSSAHLKWKGTARTSVAYWRHRLEQTVSCTGSTNPHLCARITYKGKRVRFSMETANRDAAAARAVAIYRFLVENGWEATLAKYRPDTPKPADEAQKGVTVGDFIAAAEKFSEVRVQTLRAYVQAFRKIVAEIADVPTEGKHTKVGNVVGEKWRAAVDAIALDFISPPKVQAWKQKRLRKHQSNSVLQRREATTVASSITNARSLFRKELLAHIAAELKLPEILPFEGISAERPKPARYQSRIDAVEILRRASSDLAPLHPESYKIFLLSLVCGLRISETDHLLWSRIRFDQKTLRIEDSQYHRLKSENSAGDLDLDDEVIDLLKGFRKTAKSQFVVESDAPATQSKSGPGGRYRCQGPIDMLIRWLRAQGVHARKPIHELRKEVGSILASQQGIFAASRYLRHGDIQITAAVYADKKERVTPKLKMPA